MIRNKVAFLKALDKEEERAIRLFRTRVRSVVSEAVKRIAAKTPVWSGATLASLTINEPGFIHPGWAPTPGTNDMPLGTEPNRAKAEAVPMGKLAALSFDDPFAVWTVTNSHPNAARAEGGMAPDRSRSRAPAGQFRVTNQELLLLLQSGKI